MSDIKAPLLGGSKTLNKPLILIQDKVKAVQERRNRVKDINYKNYEKKKFIDTYGIELDMPANYIYTTFIYQPDINYIISANCQIFPEKMTFYDYDKLDTNEDPLDNDFVEKESKLSGGMFIKTYHYESNKFCQKNIRTCDPNYLHRICFSEDRTKLAIFRKKKSIINNLSNGDRPLVVDIFDCSSIDFFLKKEILTKKDSNLILTIQDPLLDGSSKVDNAFLGFSQHHKYLYVSYLRKHMMIYDVHQKEVTKITAPVINIELPSIYECFVNIGINENNIQESIIAAKKTDFRNIEFFSIAYIQEISAYLAGSSQASVNQIELYQIQSKYSLSTIRINEFKIYSTNLRFSADQSTAIFCDNNQNIQLDLAIKEKKQEQKTIRHFDGSICRFIARFGDSEFLTATASNQDKEICIRHSSDPEKKIKFYFRFTAGSTEVRDIFSYGDKIRILVTRDDEEFILYEFQNFQENHTFLQRFLESSNYIFEWPYVCYLKGQTHIIIYNAYQPDIGFFIELKSQNQDEYISNMFVSGQQYLYLVLQTKSEFRIYEKDLDKCLTIIFKNKKKNMPTKLIGSSEIQGIINKGKKTNEIKYLYLGTSDYFITKVYEEMEGRLVEFLASDEELLIVSKSDASEFYQIKIFDINSSLQAKLRCTIQTLDKDMIGAFQTVNFFQNNMIPSGNDLYTIVQNGNKTYINSYKNIIDLPKKSGNAVTFASPFMNFNFRKMIYFIVNKSFLKPKRGLILPYINDNYLVFNKRENLTQYCQFVQYRHPVTLINKLDVLTYVPFKKEIIHYNQNGQIQQIFSLKKCFQTYGETTIAQSTNGHYFLQMNEDDLDSGQLAIMEMKIEPFYSGLPQKYKALSAFEINRKLIENQQKIKETQYGEAGFFLKELINLSEIQTDQLGYDTFRKNNLKELIQYFRSQHCKVFYKMNDNLDILIGFLYTKEAEKDKPQEIYINELILLKKDIRQCFIIRRNEDQNLEQKNKVEQIQQMEELQSLVTNDIQQRIIDEEDQKFITFNKFEGCNDACITNEKIILWSHSNIFSGDLSKANNFEDLIQLRKSKFQIPKKQNSYDVLILNVSASQNITDDNGNYYVYLKLLMDQDSFFIKYNINKDKEFSSFDCSNEAMVFYNAQQQGFILDNDCIVDIDQGIPLYFYKTGTRMFKSQYFLGSVIDKGARFCNNNIHFLIRNRIYIPFNYFIFVLKENNKGKTLSAENYEPEAFYQLNGETILHQFLYDFKALQFILNEYEKTNPKLLNLILLKNSENQNILQLALKYESKRCVDFLLNKLSKISMNNIHTLKKNFEQLLNYNGFEDYIRLCFFQTNQMKSQQIFHRKQKYDGDIFFIYPNGTSFLDNNFYDNFIDYNQPSKQVVIRGLDAGWILKSKYGTKFLTKLSESDNMNYFSIDTVRLIVNYQWKLMKPMIIKCLFFPFILNMIVYNFYCVFVFENRKLNPDQEHYKILMALTQILLLLFTIQTANVELKQIQFHRKVYIQSFWNVLDLMTVVIAPLTVLLEFFDFSDRHIRPLMAICNLIYYLRFFYFLRIFDSSALFVRSIIEITQGIRNFLFVFMLGILGFGATFQILSNNNNYPEYEHAVFIESFISGFLYSYLLSLGEFNVESFDDSQDKILIWLLFILCSMFTTIILLNMLVAIMGESFNRVNEQSENQTIREHLKLIVENDFLIDRSKFFGDVKFLIEVMDKIEDGSEVLFNQQYKEQSEMLKSKMESLEKDLTNMMEMMKHENQQVLSVKSDISLIKNMLIKQGQKNEDELQFSSQLSFASLDRSTSRQA